MRQIRWAARSIPIAVAVLLAAALALFWIGRLEKVVEVPGEIRVRGFEVVRAPVEGSVARVAVNPGDAVDPGQLLLTLENPQLRVELAVARGELEDTRRALAEARRRRDLLVGESHPRAVAQQRSEVRRQAHQGRRLEARSEELKVALASAETNLERSQELFEAGLISATELDEARSQLEVARWRLLQAGIEAEEGAEALSADQERLLLLESEQRRSVLDLDAEIDRLEGLAEQLAAKAAELEARAGALEVRAAVAGIVAGPEPNELLRRRLLPGEEILTLLDDTEVRFVAYVPEEAVVKVRAGQAARVEISGLPKRRFDAFDGVVQEVELQPHGATGDGVPAYAVEIRIDRPWVTWEETEFYLRDGMRGIAKIRYRPNVRLLRSLLDLLVGES